MGEYIRIKREIEAEVEKWENTEETLGHSCNLKEEIKDDFELFQGPPDFKEQFYDLGCDNSADAGCRSPDDVPFIEVETIIITKDDEKVVLSEDHNCYHNQFFDFSMDSEEALDLSKRVPSFPELYSFDNPTLSHMCEITCVSLFLKKMSDMSKNCCAMQENI